MTPEIWTKAIEQAPGLCVLAFIVFLFLKHLKSYNQMIRDMNRENLQAREQSRVVIEENTKAVARNTDMLVNIMDAVHMIRNHGHQKG